MLTVEHGSVRSTVGSLLGTVIVQKACSTGRIFYCPPSSCAFVSIMASMNYFIKPQLQ